MQSEYSTVPVDWTMYVCVCFQTEMQPANHGPCLSIHDRKMTYSMAMRWYEALLEWTKERKKKRKKEKKERKKKKKERTNEWKEEKK